MSTPALLDSNIVIAILRGDPAVFSKAVPYLREHRRYDFSEITRYEVLRGYMVRKAPRQLMKFRRFCQDNEVVPLTPEIIDLAASIYADLYRQGQLIGDADILIGATALVEGRRLITDNMRHLERIPDLVVENWLAST